MNTEEAIQPLTESEFEIARDTAWLWYHRRGHSCDRLMVRLVATIDHMKESRIPGPGVQQPASKENVEAEEND